MEKEKCIRINGVLDNILMYSYKEFQFYVLVNVFTRYTKDKS